MLVKCFRTHLLGVSLVVVAACANPAPAVTKIAPPSGADLGPSSRAPARFMPAVARAPAEPLGQATRVHDGHNDAHGVGTVNSVDPAGSKINLSHEPIQAIGWPAMTMDFAVAPAVDLKSIQAGTRVEFTIEKGKGGIYEIRALRPVRR